MTLELLVRSFFVELVKSVAHEIAENIHKGSSSEGTVEVENGPATPDSVNASNVQTVEPEPTPVSSPEAVDAVPSLDEVLLPTCTPDEPVKPFEDLGELIQFVSETHQRVDLVAGTTKVREVIVDKMGFGKVTDIPVARWQELRQLLSAL